MDKRIISAAAVFAFQLFWSGLSLAQTILTFDKAMEIAMQHSPTVIRSKIDLERSRQNMVAQEASLKSKFSLSITPLSLNADNSFDERTSSWYNVQSKKSLGVFTISQPFIATNGTLSLNNRFNWQDSQTETGNNPLPKNVSNSNNLSLSYQQPLFTYNSQKMNLKELQMDLETTELNYAIQKLTMERQVTQSFYSLYQQKSNVQIAEDELKNEEKSYEIIKNKVDAGLEAPVQKYQAEINIANSRLSYQNSKVSLEEAYDSFKILVGIPLSDSITIEADINQTPVKVDQNAAIEMGIKNSTTLRQQRVSLETAYDNLIRTRAQNEFKGNLTLSYGVQGTDDIFNDMYINPTQTKTVGITLDIPIFDWGANKARVKSSELAIERQKNTMNEQKDTITRTIRQICRDLENTAAQIDIAQQSVKLAELTYDIHLEEYKTGGLTSMDLSLYQQQLSSRKTNLVSLLISYKLALLDLKIQTLYDFEKNVPVHLE